MEVIEAYLVSVGHIFIKGNMEKIQQHKVPAETSWEVFLISKFSVYSGDKSRIISKNKISK